MTEEQLKTAAIKLCELRGENPEDIVSLPSPQIDGMILTIACSGPRWMLAKIDIERELDRQMVREAMRFAGAK